LSTAHTKITSPSRHRSTDLLWAECSENGLADPRPDELSHLKTTTRAPVLLLKKK